MSGSDAQLHGHLEAGIGSRHCNRLPVAEVYAQPHSFRVNLSGQEDRVLTDSAQRRGSSGVDARHCTLGDDHKIVEKSRVIDIKLTAEFGPL